jgi:hypothetical protein
MNRKKLTKAQESRRASLLPGGVPRYVRCYDFGEKTVDRFTIVYTGRYKTGDRKSYLYLGCSVDPFHPCGVGVHNESQYGPVDRPSYGHLGKPVKFVDLPERVRQLVLSDYREIWDL